jgi:hypothetical protein
VVFLEELAQVAQQEMISVVVAEAELRVMERMVALTLAVMLELDMLLL